MSRGRHREADTESAAATVKKKKKKRTDRTTEL
jgi:hypothetical protein